MEEKDGVNLLYLRGDPTILYGRFNLIHPGLFSSLSIFSQLKDHLTRDFVELNSMGRDIQEIIGDVFVARF